MKDLKSQYEINWQVKYQMVYRMVCQKPTLKPVYHMYILIRTCNRIWEFALTYHMIHMLQKYWLFTLKHQKTEQILRIIPDLILLIILETVKSKRMSERFGDYRCNSSCQRISKHRFWFLWRLKVTCIKIHVR